MKMSIKLNIVGFSKTLCNWTLDFLKSRHQRVWISSHASSTLVLNTIAPQGCVFGPLLFTLYTYDCTPRHQEISIVKYEDNTTIFGHKYKYKQ